MRREKFNIWVHNDFFILLSLDRYFIFFDVTSLTRYCFSHRDSVSNKLGEKTQELRKTAAGANAATITPSFADDGAMTQVDFAFSGESAGVTYGYDKANKLTSQGISNTDYACDFNCVKTLGSYTDNALNQYTTVDGISMSYDDNGNLTGDGEP